MEEVTNDELCALVLSWCKVAHPDFYDQTLKVATNATAFRKYLIRLVELRSGEDRVWRNSECPIRVLDETSMTIHVRRQGEVFELKGKKAQPPIDHRIGELSYSPEGFEELQNLKTVLDLTYSLPIS